MATESEPTGGSPLRALMTAGATLTGNAYLIVGSLFWATMAVLIGWIPPRGNVVFYIAKIWGKTLLLASWCRARRRFAAELDPTQRYVFMANHSSLFDIPSLLSTLPVQTRFLAKKSLFQIPIFGWAIALGGFVNIDRKNPRTARDSFSTAIGRLRQGTSLLVFPEGTRSMDRNLLPFKRGGFLLALKSGLPIVPVGVKGSQDVQLRRSFKIRPGSIQVHYGTPIEVEKYTVREKDRLMEDVRSAIEDLRAG